MTPFKRKVSKNWISKKNISFNLVKELPLSEHDETWEKGCQCLSECFLILKVTRNQRNSMVSGHPACRWCLEWLWQPQCWEGSELELIRKASRPGLWESPSLSRTTGLFFFGEVRGTHSMWINLLMVEASCSISFRFFYSIGWMREDSLGVLEGLWATKSLLTWKPQSFKI